MDYSYKQDIIKPPKPEVDWVETAKEYLKELDKKRTQKLPWYLRVINFFRN